MSDSFSPASAMAFSAASACNWICDMFGMTPSSVVSAALTMASWFLRMSLALRWTEQGKGDLVVELFERDYEPHVEFERFRRLRTIDDVAHHARAFVEFDHGDGVRRGEAGRGGTMIDDVTVKLALAARLEHADLARGAGRAERAWREIDIRTGVAALQSQFAGSGAIPEMLGLRRRFRLGARSFGHIGKSSHQVTGDRPFCCGLDATFYYFPSTGQ